MPLALPRLQPTNTPPPDAAPSTPPWLLGPDAPCPPEQPSAQACPVCFCDWAPLAPKHCFLGPFANMHRMHLGCVAHLVANVRDLRCPACRAGWPAWGRRRFKLLAKPSKSTRPILPRTYAQYFRAVAARGRRAPPPGCLASMGNRPPLRCALVVSPRQPPASGLCASRLRRACLTYPAAAFFRRRSACSAPRSATPFEH